MSKPPPIICPTCGRTLRSGIVGKSKLAKALFAQRAERALTVRQAGEQAKVNASTFFRCERGKQPDVETAVRLAAWLGKSLDALFMTRDRSGRA
jgi:DNA-binding XRE family transcriptional regulator